MCATLLVLHSCVEVRTPFSKLPPGLWRAELSLSEDQKLPFTFEVFYDENDVMTIEIQNADERISLDEISFGRNENLEDTFQLNFPIMDAQIDALYRENVLEGEWVLRNRGDYRLPFVAYHGQNYRFSQNNEAPKANLTGRWEVYFEVETPGEYPALGEFVQQGNQLTGTFLTETGDYRFLEGEVQGGLFMMSTFDGSHAYLFTGQINEEDQLTGTFYSGNHYKTSWIGKRNENFTLKNAYLLSSLKKPDQPIDFSFENTDGEWVRLSDEKFSQKPKIISIMGTWCPNCLDESRFLVSYMEQNPSMNIELFAIGFERYKEKERALRALKRYKEVLDVPYHVLYGGYYNKDEATEQLGFLDKVIAYPTLIFVDRENRVKRIHTGFSGPATDEYEDFVRSFSDEVEHLISG
jgi:thiol-disulfide isomerase/thioredoxin